MTRSTSSLFLVASLLLCFGVAAAGSYFTHLGLTNWYPNLIKPEWNPPNWVFGPVWTILYALMAIALWLVWKAPSSKSKSGAYWLFGLQLTANLVWSGLFFALHCPLCSLIDAVVLWFLITATIYVFFNFSHTAAYLLIPYLLWVTFAIRLNTAIWLLN